MTCPEKLGFNLSSAMVTRNATITGWTIKKAAMADISIRNLKILLE
jgi:hypothetical protein